MPMRNQKFKGEWFVYSWYITGNLDINTKNDGLENCPAKAVGEGCCGEMSHDPASMVWKRQLLWNMAIFKVHLKFQLRPQIVSGTFPSRIIFVQEFHFCLFKVMFSFHGESPWKTHHFWEKYLSWSLDFHSHRFRRVANPSPSKKPRTSGEKRWGGRAMVCILTVHCTTLGLGGYLGVNPTSQPQRLRKSLDGFLENPHKIQTKRYYMYIP